MGKDSLKENGCDPSPSLYCHTLDMPPVIIDP